MGMLTLQITIQSHRCRSKMPYDGQMYAMLAGMAMPSFADTMVFSKLLMRPLLMMLANEGAGS